MYSNIIQHNIYQQNEARFEGGRCSRPETVSSHPKLPWRAVPTTRDHSELSPEAAVADAAARRLLEDRRQALLVGSVVLAAAARWRRPTLAAHRRRRVIYDV